MTRSAQNSVKPTSPCVKINPLLVLASNSPRRRELLQAAGISFSVQASDILEEHRSAESPKTFAERMACEKATAVSDQRPDDTVLGADTIVVVAGQILGKPGHNDDAARMLRLLSGKQHQVITGVCLVGNSISPDVQSATTLVSMERISASEIQDYIATGEPMDKAGAYAIQGIASRWISRIEGDYSNVVGLPVSLVWKMLREHKVL